MEVNIEESNDYFVIKTKNGDEEGINIHLRKKDSSQTSEQWLLNLKMEVDNVLKSKSIKQ